MKISLEIDCVHADWRIRLQAALREKKDVTLLHFDHTEHWEFCQALSIAHGVQFRLDFKHSRGFFQWPLKRASGDA